MNVVEWKRLRWYFLQLPLMLVNIVRCILSELFCLLEQHLSEQGWLVFGSTTES